MAGKLYNYYPMVRNDAEVPEIGQRLTVIRERLNQLRAADPHLAVFGAGTSYGHGYNERPVLSERDLVGLEQGFRLPREARAFLTTVHGGGTGPGYGLDVFRHERSAEPFPLTQADIAALAGRRKRERLPYLGLDLPDDEEDEEWPPGPGFVSLAHHGCGIYDVLVVAGEQRGLVWCCDMQWRPYQFGFLDWYSDWLSRSLAWLRRAPV